MLYCIIPHIFEIIYASCITRCIENFPFSVTLLLCAHRINLLCSTAGEMVDVVSCEWFCVWTVRADSMLIEKFVLSTYSCRELLGNPTYCGSFLVREFCSSLYASYSTA